MSRKAKIAANKQEIENLKKRNWVSAGDPQFQFERELKEQGLKVNSGTLGGITTYFLEQAISNVGDVEYAAEYATANIRRIGGKNHVSPDLINRMRAEAIQYQALSGTEKSLLRKRRREARKK